MGLRREYCRLRTGDCGDDRDTHDELETWTLPLRPSLRFWIFHPMKSDPDGPGLWHQTLFLQDPAHENRKGRMLTCLVPIVKKKVLFLEQKRGGSSR